MPSRRGSAGSTYRRCRRAAGRLAVPARRFVRWTQARGRRRGLEPRSGTRDCWTWLAAATSPDDAVPYTASSRGRSTSGEYRCSYELRAGGPPAAPAGRVGASPVSTAGQRVGVAGPKVTPESSASTSCADVVQVGHDDRGPDREAAQQHQRAGPRTTRDGTSTASRPAHQVEDLGLLHPAQVRQRGIVRGCAPRRGGRNGPSPAIRSRRSPWLGTAARRRAWSRLP